MTFLPVVGRELRVAARRQNTYWRRFFTALTALALCAWIWGWVTSGQPAHERGQILFRVISGLAFTFSFFAGVGITADSLSEEKREGTMGLLFLTDLRGYDVVLGKLAATSLNSLYCLMSVFPILAIPLLLGATTLGEFWRTALVLINTLFFSLAAGILVSALSRRERQSMTAALFLILFITAGPSLVGLAIALQHRTQPFPVDWLLSSAVYPAVLAFDMLYQSHGQRFWIAVAITHALTWVFLFLATLAAPRTWQDRPAATQASSWRGRWQAWRYGHGAGGLGFRRSLLELNPVTWLAGRDRMRGIHVLAALTGMGAIWLTLYLKYGSLLLDATIYFLTSYTAHSILKFMVALESCRPLADDRQTGALELLLSTPLSIQEILHGYILALKRQFGWPIILVVTADLLMLLAGFRADFMDTADSWVVLCLGMIIVFLLDLWTLGWMGLWLSLSSRKSSRAIAANVAWVLILPWTVFVLGLSLFTFLQPVTFAPSELTLLVVGFVIAIVIDVVLLSWAYTNLQARFRVVAAQRFDGRKEEPSVPPPGAEPPAVPAGISALGS